MCTFIYILHTLCIHTYIHEVIHMLSFIVVVKNIVLGIFSTASKELALNMISELQLSGIFVHHRLQGLSIP